MHLFHKEILIYLVDCKFITRKGKEQFCILLEERNMSLSLSKCDYIKLSINFSILYISLGLLLSLQPPFYPSEAEKMGATPSEYGFVFGIANLSLFLFSPLFGKYGPMIGTKLCFFLGALLQVDSNIR